jgi:hypothetical protein
MSDEKTLVSAFAVPPRFSIHEVRDPVHKLRAAAALAAVAAATPDIPANLGPLTAFVGTYAGQGFNTIFRPQSAVTPTPTPGPVTSTNPADNLLELNLTQETLSFNNNLVSIPNRGSNAQADQFLNGVPYLQSISDVTSGAATGIHFEPGLWLAVPATTNPNEPKTVARMASIPHGTTIIAQGVALPPIPGKPTIGSVGITPLIGGDPTRPFRFDSQTASNAGTLRIPQDLTSFVAAGSITQTILDDPNELLRLQIANQTIAQTIVIEISTRPGSPLSSGPLLAGAHPSAPDFGGGTSNIAFLLGEAAPTPGGPKSNANAFQMDAVFWIETVLYDIDVPPLPEGTPPVVLDPVQKGSVPVTPQFVAAIPFVPGKGFAGGRITVASLQIQYSQKVMLDFSGLSWPHVSVASLAPSSPIPIPDYFLPLT